MRTKCLNFLGYSSYTADSSGKIYNTKRKIYMATYTNNVGYTCVSLTNDDGKKVNELVHLLIAKAFIPKTKKELTDVDHKDNDKTNNKASNLKWITHSDNIKKTYHTEGFDIGINHSVLN